MRILYLSCYFLEFVHYPIVKLAEDFGIDYFVYFLYNKYTALRSKDYKPQWDSNKLTSPVDKEKYKIIKHWSFPKNLFCNLMSYILYKKIEKKINKGDFDLIHAHCLYPTGDVAYRLSRKLGIPYILTTHGVDFYSALPNNGKIIYNKAIREQIKKALLGAYATIAVSEKFAQDVREYCSGANVLPVENTYNRDIFKPPAVKLPKTDIIFISVGFFIERKNHLLILNAFRDLAKTYPQIRLVLIGRGNLKETYEDFVNENHLQDFVEIKDFMPHHSLVSEYQQADFFILASKNEPFGIVCLEALACGLPLIASNTQGPIKIIEKEKDGVIFENNSLEDLKDKMTYMIQNYHNYDDMTKNALNKADLYKNKHHIVYGIYLKALEKK